MLYTKAEKYKYFCEYIYCSNYAIYEKVKVKHSPTFINYACENHRKAIGKNYRKPEKDEIFECEYRNCEKHKEFIGGNINNVINKM